MEKREINIPAKKIVKPVKKKKHTVRKKIIEPKKEKKEWGFPNPQFNDINSFD